MIFGVETPLYSVRMAHKFRFMAARSQVKVVEALFYYEDPK
jgi:hypothetical protein